MNKSVLVTGGSGLVGKSLRNLLKENKIYDNKYNYIFLSSKECDLRSEIETDALFNIYKPKIVIHLANVVAGLYGNMSNNYTMLVDNIKINTNILEACRKYNVKRLINCLSTCVFGNNLNYPLTSDQILKSPCDKSNEGYSVSKRMLYSGSEFLCKCSDIEIINLIPTNLYGRDDNYNLYNSHVIPGLIAKTFTAKKNFEQGVNGTSCNLIIKGDGSALRQFVYADDFSRIIIEFTNCDLLKSFNNIIVGPSVKDEITIKQLVNKIVNIFNYKGKVIYDVDFSNGQHKKTVDNKELLEYIPNFKFKSLNDGLEETINYYINNYEKLRK